MSRGYRLQLRVSYNAKYIQECAFIYTELPLAHPHTTTPSQSSARFSREPQSCAVHTRCQSLAQPHPHASSPQCHPLAHAAPPRPRRGSNLTHAPATSFVRLCLQCCSTTWYLYLYLKLKYLYWYWYLRLCTCRHAEDHSESVTIYQQRNVCQR